MTESQRRDRRSRSRARLLTSGLLVVLCAGLTGRSMATGYFGPDEYLSDWTSLDETPEFYWQLEVQRMARDFHPKEKLMLARLNPALKSADDLQDAATSQADAADFDAALKDGEIKPPDPADEKDRHAAARDGLQGVDDKTTDPTDTEFASEFADYDLGAYQFRRGKAHWDEARKAWTALLNRPAAQRHYRTVWAAFMLGKLAMEAGDPEAATWFEKTRQFAAQGFADSLGLAADSYGWEGRAEWKQGHPEKAAPMYLSQLALGDVSAVVSLKALIPDRDNVDQMMNYADGGVELYTHDDGSDGTTPPTDAEKKAAEPRLIEKLKAMAADPILRKLETAHILATESGGNNDFSTEPGKPARSQRWLQVLASVKPEKVEDAEYLGWVAYTTGNYREAQRWLGLSDGKSPVASWLRARLELRAGDVADAAASMAQAWQGIWDPSVYTGGTPLKDQEGEWSYLVPAEDAGLSMQEWVNGDMAAVQLMRSDFVQAMDTFLKAGLLSDAAYVAERVLTTAELKAYVDKMTAAHAKPYNLEGAQSAGAEPDQPAPDNTSQMRYLFGRRLVREDRYADAAPYFPPAYGKLLGKYVEALKQGADSTLPRAKRAEAWSTAAWLARHDGLELMGTEVAPDGFNSGGNFEDPDVAKARISGIHQPNSDQDETTPTRLSFPAVKTEVARLKENQIRPDLRYHYRIIAAALAVRAASLMDDNTEELADALNTAGLWVKDRDEKLGYRYYQIIEKRCAKTKIGQAVISKHWFVDQSGPWSDGLKAASDALHTQLGIQDPG